MTAGAAAVFAAVKGERDKRASLAAAAASDEDYGRTDTERGIGSFNDGGADPPTSLKALAAEAAARATDRLPYQQRVRELYQRKLTQYVVAVLISVNFVVVVIEKEIDPFPPPDQRYRVVWAGLDNAFNGLFLIELLINMYGHYFFAFWRSGFNIFDFVVVVVGVVLMTEPLWPRSVDLGPLTIFKTLRAFRIFRLFKRIKSFNKILVSLVRSVPGVLNAFAIMLIFMCIYAILAVDSFRTFGAGGSYSSCPGSETCGNVTAVTPRGIEFGDEYYGTFFRSLYTLFQVLTGESWSEAVARPLLFGLHEPANGALVGLFFVSFIVLHQIVLVNVVVAVLLDKIVEDESNYTVDEPAGADPQPLPAPASADSRLGLAGAANGAASHGVLASLEAGAPSGACVADSPACARNSAGTSGDSFSRPGGGESPASFTRNDTRQSRVHPARRRRPSPLEVAGGAGGDALFEVQRRQVRLEERVGMVHEDVDVIKAQLAQVLQLLKAQGEGTQLRA